MFREKNEALELQGVNHQTTVLNEDASFEGKLDFEGNVLVNGKFKGEIYSTGELTIGQTGVVEGKIEIGVIHIFGEVRGNILAKEKIEINSPAIVRGDIVAPSLIIKEGAVFEGNCSMGDLAARKAHGTDKVVEFNKMQKAEEF
jgi:cytoskeletal protein CcmA (bactofilin family)